MGFTTVPDKAGGDVFTEAMWDTYIKGNLNTGVPVLLASSLLAAPAAMLDLTSIPQTWSHLQLVALVRGDTAAATIATLCRFNNDATANYDWQESSGALATPASAEGVAVTGIESGIGPANTAPAGSFAPVSIIIPQYTATVANKVCVGQAGLRYNAISNGLRNYQWFGHWRSAVAITRIQLLPATGNFVTGSCVSLYGMP